MYTIKRLLMSDEYADFVEAADDLTWDWGND